MHGCVCICLQAFEIQSGDLATPATKLVTIATQTSDVDLPDSSLEVARELQYGDQNTVYALYHGSWPTPLEQGRISIELFSVHLCMCLLACRAIISNHLLNFS